MGVVVASFVGSQMRREQAKRVLYLALLVWVVRSLTPPLPVLVDARMPIS